MRKKYASFLLTALLLASCSNTPTSSPLPSSDSASTSSESSSSREELYPLVITGETHLAIREYITLTCTYNGEEVSPNWSSSDTSIATISSTGMVKGLNYGQVTITATYTVNNEEIKGTYDLVVEDSWTVGSVISKLTSSSYRVDFDASGVNYDSITDSSFSLSIYKNGFYYEASDSSFYLANYGYGVSQNKTFEYTLKDGKVDSALYLRYPTSDFLSLFYHLSSINSGYFNRYQLDTSNTYTIEDTTIQSLFFMMGSQFVSSSQTSFMTTLSNSTFALTFTITSSSSFTASLKIQDSDEETLATFSFGFSQLEEENYSALSAFLSSSSPSYPEIYSDITNIYELSKTHNYTRDFGKYRGDNLTIDIGRGYFTKDYVFVYFTDEYIEQTKETMTYQSHGYINIHGKEGYSDGVYSFTIEKDEETNEDVVVLGEREKRSDGSYYSYYYEFYENLTLILEMLEEDLYTFAPVSIDSGNNNYGSYASSAANITTQLFSDYINAGIGLEASGLLLSIAYNSLDPNSSSCQLGGLFSYSGSSTYDFDAYPYTNFNTTSSSFMEEYIASLS